MVGGRAGLGGARGTLEMALTIVEVASTATRVGSDKLALDDLAQKLKPSLKKMRKPFTSSSVVGPDPSLMILVVLESCLHVNELNQHPIMIDRIGLRSKIHLQGAGLSLTLQRDSSDKRNFIQGTLKALIIIKRLSSSLLSFGGPTIDLSGQPQFGRPPSDKPQLSEEGQEMNKNCSFHPLMANRAPSIKGSSPLWVVIYHHDLA